MKKPSIKQIKYWKSLRGKRGIETPRWKGDRASIQSKHDYLKKHFGTASYCVNPNCEGKSKFFDWCLITGRKYSHNPNDYLWLCRKCHRKYDLTPEKEEKAKKNLWWNTGTKINYAKGEKINNAKLDTEKVLRIREDYKVCKNYAELARKYGVTPPTIQDAVKRITWKHI